MVLKIVCLLMRWSFSLAVLVVRGDRAKDAELLVLRHEVLNRNILANAQHAYALYWSTAQSDWSTDYPIFAVLARTFQPAPERAS